MSTATPTHEVLTSTLDLLEWRLRRLEFVLDGRFEGTTGQFSKAPEGTPTVATRVRRLEQSMLQLARNSDVALDLLRLNSRLPELFTSDPTPSEEVDTTTPTAQKLTLLLAEAPSYTSTAAQLRHVEDHLPPPPSSSFSSIISLAPKMAQLRERQAVQAEELTELRKRSAEVVLRWHDVFVLGVGRCVGGWDGRVTDVERVVRREERRRKGE